MEKPENPIIDFPIDRINKFLENYTFNVPLFNNPTGIKIPIKIKLTGMKNLISVGDWTPFITYEFHVVPGNANQNFMSSMHFGNPHQTEMPTPIDTKLRDVYPVLENMNQLLRNFLKYWGVEHRITCTGGFTHVPYNIDIKNVKF